MIDGLRVVTNGLTDEEPTLTEDQLLVVHSFRVKVHDKYRVMIDTVNICTADDGEGNTCLYLMGAKPGEDRVRWFVLAEFPKATELHDPSDSECGCLGCRVGRDPVAFIHICATRPPQGGIYEASIVTVREGRHERVEIERLEI